MVFSKCNNEMKAPIVQRKLRLKEQTPHNSDLRHRPECKIQVFSSSHLVHDVVAHKIYEYENTAMLWLARFMFLQPSKINTEGT